MLRETIAASVYWPWFPWCARQVPGHPDCAWTYSMLRHLLKQDCYGRRVYLVGFSDLQCRGVGCSDPRWDILRRGGPGMRGLDLTVSDIAIQTGQREDTVKKHLAKLSRACTSISGRICASWLPTINPMNI
jgi:hypothetical protein